MNAHTPRRNGIINTFTFAALSAVVFLAGCSTSGIVQGYLDAGGGDPHHETDAEIEQFVRSNHQLAINLHRDCNGLSTSVTAQWRQTTEGRICIAAWRVGAF